MSIRDAILAADDLPRVSVVVPEWGQTLQVRTMTAEDRDRFEDQCRASKDSLGTDNFRARLVAFCCVDDAGVRVFGDGDVQALGRKSARAVGRLFAVALKLNALAGDDVEVLAQNFPDAPSGSSTST